MPHREEAVASEQKERPTSAELLQRAMVTPPLAERRVFRREASVGLTPESNTPSLSADRCTPVATHLCLVRPDLLSSKIPWTLLTDNCIAHGYVFGKHLHLATLYVQYLR